MEAAGTSSPPSGHCLSLVKAHDPDRYHSILFAPEAKREALAALFAFDAEIDAIAGRVREALPGEIRLQWWREVLNGERHGEAQGHPIASPLLAAIRDYRLSVDAFDRLLDARLFDLYHDPMPDRTALEGYLGDTVSSLMVLAAQMLNDGQPVSLGDAAGHGGVCAGLVRIMQRLPISRSRGQIHVPADMLAAARIGPDAFLAGPQERDAERLWSLLCAMAREHLARFRGAAAIAPATLRPALLPVAGAAARLSVLERAGGRAIMQNVRQPRLRPLAAIAWHGARGWRRSLT